MNKMIKPNIHIVDTANNIVSIYGIEHKINVGNNNIPLSETIEFLKKNGNHEKYYPNEDNGKNSYALGLPEADGRIRFNPEIHDINKDWGTGQIELIQTGNI